MANTRTQSVNALRGTNNFHFHRLLPNESNTYSMNENKVGQGDQNETDIEYSDLDPTAISDHLWIKKVSCCILGPKINLYGAFFLVIEKEGDEDDWVPLLICDDGQMSASVEWPDGYEVKMDDEHMFCASVQYLEYPMGQTSWTYGTGWVKRAVELDILYHVGD